MGWLRGLVPPWWPYHTRRVEPFPGRLAVWVVGRSPGNAPRFTRLRPSPLQSMRFQTSTPAITECPVSSTVEVGKWSGVRWVPLDATGRSTSSPQPARLRPAVRAPVLWALPPGDPTTPRPRRCRRWPGGRGRRRRPPRRRRARTAMPLTLWLPPPGPGLPGVAGWWPPPVGGGAPAGPACGAGWAACAYPVGLAPLLDPDLVPEPVG